jgi:hypothetical protein
MMAFVIFSSHETEYFSDVVYARMDNERLRIRTKYEGDFAYKEEEIFEWGVYAED